MLAGFLSLKSKAFARGFPPARDVPNVERKRILSAYSSAASSLRVFLFCFVVVVIGQKERREREKERARRQCGER